MASCKKKLPKAFESSKPCNDVSAVLYASMLQSPAWKKLTKHNRFYMYTCAFNFTGIIRFLVNHRYIFTLIKLSGRRLTTIYESKIFLQRSRCPDRTWVH